MKKLLFITTALMIASPVVYAEDGFGKRFGNSTPYALDNNVNNALDDTQDIGIEDINDLVNIAPAAGEETNASVTIDAEAGSEDAKEDDVISGQIDATAGTATDVVIEPEQVTPETSEGVTIETVTESETTTETPAAEPEAEADVQIEADADADVAPTTEDTQAVTE
jgi:hypothetical protein